MSNVIDSIESIVRWLGVFAGLSTLAYAVYNMLKAQTRPSGVLTGAANRVLRTPYLIISTLLFGILVYILWKPLPIQLSWQLRLLFMLTGGGVFFTSLILYLWGLRTLGSNFNASSGFGVRLHQAHQLITNGPYAYVRHPMYLAVILASWSGLLLYRTWTMLLFAGMMLGLLYRARKEEDALSQAIGEDWEEYKHRVPGWIPRIDSLRHIISPDQ